MRKAAAYLRVSTVDQADKYGLKSQETAINAYAEREGLEIINTYSDAVTGTKEDRPGILSALASTSNYDHLVIYDHTRLGRKVRVSASLRARFQEKGIEVHYVASGGNYKSDSETGIIMDAMQDAMSEVEVRRLVRRSKAGRKAAVKEGDLQIGGRVPFGYDRIYATKLRGQRLETNPVEAAHVRQIFRWFAEGLGKAEIARRMNDMGAKKHNGYPWTRHDMYRMLKDEIYIGRWYFGKTKKVNGKQVKRDRSEWIEAKVPVIVDLDLWRRAQTFSKATTKAYQKRVSHKYLLRQRIKCAHCDEFYNAHTQSYRNRKGDFVRYFPYYMHNFRTQKSCENHTHLSVDKIEDQVKDFIMDWLYNPDTKWSDVIEEAEQTQNFLQDQLDAAIKKIDGLEGQVERAQKAYTEGAFDLDALTTQVERIETEREELIVEERRLRNELEPDWLELELDRQEDEWAAEQFEELGKDFLSWLEWLNLFEMFDVQLEVNQEGKVMLSCRVDSAYPLSVASPKLNM